MILTINEVLIILGLVLFCIIAMFAYGKVNKKGFAVPLALAVLGNALLLLDVFITNDGIVRWLIWVPAILLVLIEFVWTIVKLIKKDINWRKVLVSLLCWVLTIFISIMPTNGKEDRFYVYKTDYNMVACAMFQAYDEGKLTDKYDFVFDYDQNDMKSIFSDEVIKKMDGLKSRTGVYRLTVKKDTVYFFYGAEVQPTDGIAIFRKAQSGNPNIKLIDYYGKEPSFIRLTENTFYFYGGLFDFKK